MNAMFPENGAVRPSPTLQFVVYAAQWPRVNKKVPILPKRAILTLRYADKLILLEANKKVIFIIPDSFTTFNSLRNYGTIVAHDTGKFTKKT